MPLHKRKWIEERLGCPLRAYLRARFLKKATQKEVARELGVDSATVRYYIKKWDLPYDLKAVREKKRKEAKIRWDHLEVCICAICKYRFCEEAKESHKRGRCVSCRATASRAGMKPDKLKKRQKKSQAIGGQSGR